jgi:hypothetical protein
LDGVSRIYGGDDSQPETFNSHTMIDIVHLNAGKSMKLAGEQLIYVIAGEGNFSESQANAGDEGSSYLAQDGDLLRTLDVSLVARKNLHLLVVSQQA